MSERTRHNPWATPPPAPAGGWTPARRTPNQPTPAAQLPPGPSGALALPTRRPTPPPPPSAGAGVDPELVSEIREAVDTLLDAEIAAREADPTRAALDQTSERALAGSLLNQVLPRALGDWTRRGRRAPNPEDDYQGLRAAVLAEMFGLGRLEQLLAQDDVENVDITGCDPARLTLTDGSRRLGPPVASSDDELVKLLRRIAERRTRVERSINNSRPLLNLELPGGQRLAATMGVSARPAVSIRIHRFRRITLEQLASFGTLSAAMVGFLSAAVRGGLNIVVTGEQTAGKTTLLRGLCDEIPADEQLATLETEFELGLHRFPDRWPDVLALEERQPNSERVENGLPVGGITLDQLVWHALRMHRSRLIFGEVRGNEIIAMLNALSTGGAGALSTLHSRSAHGAVPRMVSLCLGANPSWTEVFANRLIAESIDLIVHVRFDRVRDHTGMIALDRYVDEISAISQGEDGRVAFTRLFRPDPTGRFGRRGIPTGHTPPRAEDYAHGGFDPALLRGTDGGGWQLPTRAVAG